MVVHSSAIIKEGNKREVLDRFCRDSNPDEIENVGSIWKVECKEESASEWTSIYQGPQEKSYQQYESVLKTMNNGGVRILDERGVVVEQCWIKHWLIHH